MTTRRSYGKSQQQRNTYKENEQITGTKMPTTTLAKHLVRNVSCPMPKLHEIVFFSLHQLLHHHDHHYNLPPTPITISSSLFSFCVVQNTIPSANIIKS